MAQAFDNLSRMPQPRPEVRGIDLDEQTRCTHYRTDLDVIAIKMKCCGVYYACKDCHQALAGHPIEVWPRAEWTQPAVLCGVCGFEMSIEQYMSIGYACPHCAAAFNPGCRKHYTHYFEHIRGAGCPRSLAFGDRGFRTFSQMSMESEDPLHHDQRKKIHLRRMTSLRRRLRFTS
jgi:uncharacterized CHY-type Zn-finger protein